MKGGSLMAGWNLKAGAITEYVVSEDRIWSLFNFVFSDACKKRNTYKFGLIKSLLDSAFSGEMTEQGVRYSYEELFGRFAYNYWNLVVKYEFASDEKRWEIRVFQKIELIFKDVIKENNIFINLEFESHWCGY